MIRDLSQKDKIKYSKSFVNESAYRFLWFWFCSAEGMFEDIDFYVAKTFWHEFTFKAKMSGIVCGLIVLPFIFVTFILILLLANIGGRKRSWDPTDFKPHSVIQAIARGTVILFLLIPFSLIRFPLSLHSYFAFKKRALFYLLEVDSDYDSSS